MDSSGDVFGLSSSSDEENLHVSRNFYDSYSRTREEKMKERGKRLVVDLKEYVPKSGRCNILCFGLTGHGRSRLCNLLLGRYCNSVHLGRTRYSPHIQTTTKYWRNEVNDRVSVGDTPGWNGLPIQTGSNFSEQGFVNLLEGSVRVGSSLSEISSQKREDERRDSRAIHIVIFVVDDKIIRIPLVITSFRGFFNICERRKIPALFVVTKLGEEYETQNAREISVDGSKDPEAMFRKITNSWNHWNKIVEVIRSRMNHPLIPVMPILLFTKGEDLKEKFKKKLVQKMIEISEKPPNEDIDFDERIRYVFDGVPDDCVFDGIVFFVQLFDRKLFIFRSLFSSGTL